MTHTKSKSDKRPAINCAHAALVGPEKLQLNPKNPNRHSAEQLRLYAKIILHQGWRKAVVVSKRSGLVVTGAGATLCAREQKWAVVPVDYQEFASEADEYAHLLADNRLPQMAELDEDLLAEIMRDDISGKLDEELTGLSLEGPEEPVELKRIEVKAPPKMAWVLVGIPLVKFSEINAEIEAIAKRPDATVLSTVNDQVELK